MRRWLVTGASGKLGDYVVRALEATEGRVGATVITTSRTPRPDPRHVVADLRVREHLVGLLAASRPTHVLHLAGVTSLAEAAADPRRAWEVNVEASGRLARYAQDRCGWLLLASSDFVFDGILGRPYREDDLPSPQTTYGLTKVAAEQAVLSRGGTVARLSLMYGWPLNPALRSTFTHQLDCLLRSRPVRVVADEWRTPLSLGDAARVVVHLGRIGYRGVVHVGGPERMTAATFVLRCGQLLGSTPVLREVTRAQLGHEPRPADVSLDCRRLRQAAPGLAPGPMRLSALTRPPSPSAVAARYGALSGQGPGDG